MNEITPSKDRSGIQVIARAAEVLRVLEASGQALSLGEVASRTGLPRSTIQRITGALLEEGFVSHDQGNRGLRLGPEIARLGESARIDVVNLCRPILEQIADQTGETTDLAVRRGGSMVFLDQVAGSHRLRTVSAVGDVFPLSNTANGRASLAKLSDDEAWLLVEKEHANVAVPPDQNSLVSLLEKVRQSGLAYDLEEHTSGISAVGFAFQDSSGLTYAISVPVPATRFHESRSRIEDALHDARKKLLGPKTTLGFV